MEIINTINQYKVPIFKVNPELDTLLPIPMFEDKIAAANEVLRLVGLPKISKVRKKRKSGTRKQDKR